MKEIKRLRSKVDRFDRRILSLLNQRARLSKAIGELKRTSRQEIFSPDREQEVLNQLARINPGPLSREAISAIYREIMSSSKSLEKALRIAYLGPEFTFTHEAARKKFGSSVGYLPCAAISDVFSEVESGRSDYGVVPVENSTEGVVTYTLDMFVTADSGVYIYDEVYLRISHHLLSRAGSLKTVKNVYSNPQAFAQCRGWLEANLPHARLLPAQSTAAAAEFVGKISKKPKENACVASIVAAREYGLNILARTIEDNPNNTTRFIVISRTEARPTRRDRTSIAFELKDRVGALHDILVPFKRARINLTKIESRPSKKKAWSYYFFVDFEGHHREPRIRRVLDTIGRHCTFFRVLGSHPKAE